MFAIITQKIALEINNEEYALHRLKYTLPSSKLVDRGRHNDLLTHMNHDASSIFRYVYY